MAIAQLQLDETNLMSLIASGCQLDRAFHWLCKKKHNANSNDLFLGMTRNWKYIKATLRYQLQRGVYTFNPLKTVQLQDGMLVSMWHPLDSIVIKALPAVLTPLFKVKMDLTAATHLKGHGGRNLESAIESRFWKYHLNSFSYANSYLVINEITSKLFSALSKSICYSRKSRSMADSRLKQAVQKVTIKRLGNNFAYKTDIADYYASIKHPVLLEQLGFKIKDNRVMKLLQHILNRVHVRHGEHCLIENKSIPRGCSLSPLLGAIYLLPLDAWARKHKVDYVRYMDDIVILTPTRHKLRHAIKSVYTITKESGLKLSPAKTWLGRVTKGFDFLGYQISSNGVQIAKGSLSRMMTKPHRLYEQGVMKMRLMDYVNRWVSWAKAGVSLIGAPLKLNIKICPSKQRGYSFKLDYNEWFCCL